MNAEYKGTILFLQTHLRLLGICQSKLPHQFSLRCFEITHFSIQHHKCQKKSNYTQVKNQIGAATNPYQVCQLGCKLRIQHKNHTNNCYYNKKKAIEGFVAQP